MDESTREWQSRPWRVAKSDSPYNASITNCKTFLGALSTALAYRVAGRQVFIFRRDTLSSQEAVELVKLMSKARTKK